MSTGDRGMSTGAPPTLVAVSHSAAAPTLEAMTRPLLEALRTVSGLESAYLTAVDLEGDEQRVLFSANGGVLSVPEGIAVPWSDTLCRRAMESGTTCTDDVPRAFPDATSALEMGLQSYVSVPIHLPGGELVGTLCGASSRRQLPDADVLAVMGFFAQLIADRLNRDRELEAERARRAELSAFTDRVVALERTKSEFLRIAGHELRNSLTVAVGYLDMAADGAFGTLDGEFPEVVGIVRERVGEMARLVEEMMETARLEDDRLDLKLETIDLRAVAGRAAEAIRPLLDGKHSLELDLPDESVPVRVDAGRVGIVVANLLSNAVKYSPAGGTVHCAVHAKGGSALVTVSDEGVGIAPEHVDTLFSRFGRIQDRAHDGIPGTGLGLHISREIARRHGGDLVLDRGRERGAAFTLELPLQD